MENRLLINESKPRRVFKDMLGHSNHYVVTILVGLHGVASTDIVAPEGLRAAWSPKSRVSSARRSQRFALAASLAWAVDAIDAYLSLALRRPSIVDNGQLRNELHGAGQSIAKKVDVVRSIYPDTAETAGALVALAVVWRNRLVHSLAENELPAQLRTQLEKAAGHIERDYRGLDIERTMCAASRSDAPTLKETASINAACHSFVSGIDGRLLAELPLERYATEVLSEHFGQSRRRSAREQVAVLWSKDASRRKRSIGQILQCDGAAVITAPELDKWITELAELTFGEAVAKLLPDFA